MLALFFSVGISSIFFVGSSKALDKDRVICPLFYAHSYTAGRALRRNFSTFSIILILN